MCFVCTTIREILPKIDPDFCRTTAGGLAQPLGMGHDTLIAQYKVDYAGYLRGMQDKIESLQHELRVAELQFQKSEIEVKQLELNVKKEKLQREMAEAKVKTEG
jgi:hypothetical protein